MLQFSPVELDHFESEAGIYGLKLKFEIEV